MLRYDRPAEQWASEALPLGNGRLGCMVFGGVEHERIQFNEDSLWTGDENPSGDYATMGSYQAFGDLFVDFAGGPVPMAGYSRRLDLARAIHTVSFSRGGVLHTRAMFASHPDGVIVLRWTADHPGAISATFRLQGSHGESPAASGRDIRFSGKLTNGLAYEARARILATGGKVSTRGGAIEATGCDEVTVLLAAGTAYAMDPARGWRGDPPGPRVLRQVDEASKRPYQDLLARHLADYRKLFGRVSLSLGYTDPSLSAQATDRRLKAHAEGKADPELEAMLFQMGRYLLIASSRRPGLPANLQGLWNDSNTPAWSSDYHSNINLQMNYWPAEPANLSECALPFFDLVMAEREPSRRATRASFGDVHGWTLRTSHNIFGGLGWEWNLPSSAWYALHFYEHYAFTGDRGFARDVAYPMAKEVCAFWMDRLKALPDGTLVVPDGWSPEHGPREDGVSHDQQIVWELFTFTARMARDLGIDNDFQREVINMRDRLSGPKIGRWGQLQEWLADRDDPKDDHRHTSHLFAVYPGSQISTTRTPDLARAAAVSLEARGTSGDSRREWVWAWRCCLWARLGEAEKAHQMISNLLSYNTLPNLFGVHPPMQLDGNYGITAGMCEMLLQSHAGEIHLLPALPHAWAEGRVTGLRARGGFTLDIDWKDGRIIVATVHSTIGRACRVRYGDRVFDLTLAPGTTRRITAAMFSAARVARPKAP